jgi:sugar phosphate isomerase/epimerase
MLAKYLRKYNMEVISSQIKYSVITKNLEKIVSIHKKLGIEYMAISVIPFRHLLTGRLGLQKLSKKLNVLGKVLNQENIQLMFHHHNYEFIKLGKKMAFDYLIEYFDPLYVQILSDTYWIRRGAFDVIEFLDKYKSHIKAVHLRGCNKKTDTNLLNGDTNFCEVLKYITSNDFYYGVIEQNTEDELNEIDKSLKIIKECNYSTNLGGKNV